MVPQGTVSFKCRPMNVYYIHIFAEIMKSQKANSLENVTCLNWEKNKKAEKVYCTCFWRVRFAHFIGTITRYFTFLSSRMCRSSQYGQAIIFFEQSLSRCFCRNRFWNLAPQSFWQRISRYSQFTFTCSWNQNTQKGAWILPLNLLHWTSFFLLYRDEWRQFFYSALVLVEVPLLDGNSILSVALTSLQRLSLMFWSQTLVFITVKKNLFLWIWKFFLNGDRSREKSLSKINDNKVEEHSHCNR